MSGIRGGITRVTGVTRGDRTEGGEEGKGKGGGRREERRRRRRRRRRKFFCGRDEQADGIQVSLRGPRGPKIVCELILFQIISDHILSYHIILYYIYS